MKKKDIEELYNGLIYGIRNFFRTFPNKKAVIGLSGGVDSGVVAALLVTSLGQENVFAVNMPSKFNSQLTRDAAADLAKNLKINYTIFPIQQAVDLTINELKKVAFIQQDENQFKTNLEVSGLVIENIQARDRSSRVLAAIASSLGVVFTNNGNKTETAIGYTTLYGDMDGALAPIADLYKEEVYQLADYINKLAGKEIIPVSVLHVVPSAELSTKQDVTKGKGDPINYPYHDKLLRAFIEFRRDPEYILELYKNNELESMLKIETGLVNKSFKSPADFINDLEHKWKLYKINYFKRIQSPPIIAVSKRAFGFDLRESQNGVYFTKKYKKIKEELLK